MVLGGGPNRIGQGIEFDYCCVHAALALREDGFETIMVNCNPETVSTDYDTSDRLYFEPLTLEDVLEIVDKEKPWGVIVQYGGQTPLKLARDLAAAGVPIIGTSADSIDIAEDRERFQKLLDKLKLRQPRQPHRALGRGGGEARRGDRLPGGGAPELRARRARDGDRARPVRPRSATWSARCKVSNDSPVLLDRYLSDAIEVDVDCVSDGKQVLIGGIMEHVEQAGVHSGDSACCLPPHSLASHVERDLRRQTDADGEGAQGRRPDERAVRDPEGHRLRAGSEPARLAHRALRFEGDGAAARHDRARAAWPAAPSRTSTSRRSRRPTSR